MSAEKLLFPNPGETVQHYGFRGRSLRKIRYGQVSIPKSLIEHLAKEQSGVLILDTYYEKNADVRELRFYPQEIFEREVKEAWANNDSAKLWSLEMGDRVTISKDGKLVLPKEKREAAGIEEDVYVAGRRDNITFINPESLAKLEEYWSSCNHNIYDC